MIHNWTATSTHIWTAGVAIGSFLAALLLAVLALAFWSFKEAAGGLIAKEAEGRLERLPHALLVLAARRLPADLQAPLYEEWFAELCHRLRRNDGLPITRAVVGIKYALGLLVGAHKVGEALANTGLRTPTTPRRSQATYTKWLFRYARVFLSTAELIQRDEWRRDAVRRLHKEIEGDA